MINEVDEALRTLVVRDVVSGTDVEVLFDAPTREWGSRRNTPTVDLYLYDIREDISRRSVGRLEKRDQRGAVIERRSLPRYFKLSYLITAWTQRPEDEHRLLTAMLVSFLRHDVLPDSALPETLKDLGAPLGVQIAYPPPEDRQVSDVWTALGGDLKLSIDLIVTMPVQPERLEDIAQAVLKPLRLRAKGESSLPTEAELRHRPDEPYEDPVRGSGGQRPRRAGRVTSSPARKK